MRARVFPTSYYACRLLQPRRVITRMSLLKPVVLVIDDDEAVHDSLRLVLEDDYELISALRRSRGPGGAGRTSCRPGPARPVDTEGRRMGSLRADSPDEWARARTSRSLRPRSPSRRRHQALAALIVGEILTPTSTAHR